VTLREKLPAAKKRYTVLAAYLNSGRASNDGGNPVALRFQQQEQGLRQ
jgi:hypothetical protein